MVGHVKREKRTNHSSILRPGTTGFTCGNYLLAITSVQMIGLN